MNIYNVPVCEHLTRNKEIFLQNVENKVEDRERCYASYYYFYDIAFIIYKAP